MMKNGSLMRRVLAALLTAVLLAGGLTGCLSKEETEELTRYDPAAIVARYHGDLSTGLYIFPKELPGEDAEYHIELTTNLLDTDAAIILKYTYPQEAYEEEIARLQGITAVISDGKESVTNTVRYDEDSYRYPAYVTIDGFASTWEYALTDEKTGTIVYVFLSYPVLKDLEEEYGEYLKKDRSAYEVKDPTAGYSLYCHSFDGGKSFAEFDDDWTETPAATEEPTTEEGNEMKQTTLSFDSFDGGGPLFTEVIADESVVTCSGERKYRKPDHEKMNGAGYDMVYTFTGHKPGITLLTVSARSPIADNYDKWYVVSVDEELRVTLSHLGTLDPLNDQVPARWLEIEANGTVFYARPEENDSWEEFAEFLREAPLTLSLHDYGNFEKVGSLPWEVTRTDTSITTEPGDVILYNGDQITVYYDTNTWNFTRLAKIPAVTRPMLLDVFGAGDVTVTFRLVEHEELSGEE